jgi:hypothetical protein
LKPLKRATTLLAEVFELRPTPAKSSEKAVSRRVQQFLDGNQETS